MRKLMLAVAVPFVLGACVSAPKDAAPEPMPDMAECNAAPAQAFVGKLSTPERNVEIQRLTGSRTLRWIGPGIAVTMDYRMDRVNVFYDEQKFVTQISCG